jgi:hypothetical protein
MKDRPFQISYEVFSNNSFDVNNASEGWSSLVDVEVMQLEEKFDNSEV